MFIFEKFIDKYKSALAFSIVIIIAVATLVPLFSHPYFTMHDDQHVARLYLLDQAINQGTLYPRWVDQLGFGFGYPLFNFYPPLTYYIAEIFRSLSIGYITSIKLMLLTATLIGTIGSFSFLKKIYGTLSALVGTMLFTFFSYRAITLYVRGAFAEYLALSFIPWILLSLYNLYRTPSLKNALITGLFMALLVLAHPFIAIPGVFVIVSFAGLLYFLTQKSNRQLFLTKSLISGAFGLALSAFFWLPSMVERSYTLVDTILLNELAKYAIHFVQPQQLWYSPWGFGGSVEGLGDGLSFQINKPYIGMVFLTTLLWLWFYRTQKSKHIEKNIRLVSGYFLFMLIASVFLMLPYSKFIWDSISYLQYLQFPWRLMAFVGLFISFFSASFIYLLTKTIRLSALDTDRLRFGIAACVFFMVFVVQQKYFKPQQFIETSDATRTNFKEIAWRISSTSFEFVPKGVRTKKTAYNTTTLDIEEKDIADRTHKVINGAPTVDILAKQFDYKRFSSDSNTPYTLQINTYNFPGWTGYIDGKEAVIHDNNDFKLIQINVPMGRHIVEVKLTKTPIQKVATAVSLIAWLYLVSALYLSLGSGQKPKKV